MLFSWPIIYLMDNFSYFVDFGIGTIHGYKS